MSRTCSKWDSVVKNTKKKCFWKFWAILRVFSLHFPKPFERAPYVTTTEIPLDTVCLNKTWSRIPKPFLSYVTIFFFFFFLVLRIFETLRSRSKGITWKIFFIKAWDLSWRKLTDFLRCGLKQNDLKITGAFLACSIINAAYRLEFLSTFKCFVPHNVWKHCLDDLSFQETCF